MKTGTRKLLCVFLTVLMLVLSFETPVFAAVQGGDSIQNCAEELKQLYRDWNDPTLAGVDPEALARNYQATLDYNKIVDHVNSYEGVLRQYFAGAWINDEDTLVVAFSGKADVCRELVVKIIGTDDVIFTEGTGSYYRNMKTLDKVYEAITALYDNVREGKAVSANAAKLVELKPHVEYDDEANKILIKFKTDEETELAVRKSADERAALNDKERAAVDLFNEAVAMFKADVIDGEDIIFIASTEDCTLKLTATEWRPGRSIYVRNKSNGGVGYASSGYRVKMTYNSKNYTGFLTCGHKIYVGYGIYTKNTTSSTYKLGTVIRRKYSGKVDASFFELANSSYTTSNAIYYTSSQAGVTRPGTILDGTYTTVAKGTTIYKSGRATYLTIGKVKSTSVSGENDGTTISDLFMADRVMAAAGDSGAVTYIVSGTGATSGKAVGIENAITDDYTFFVKAGNIKSYLGAYPFK